MKYNKIALSLLLLASSAFASFTYPNDSELETLANDIRSEFPLSEKNSTGVPNDFKVKASHLTKASINRLMLNEDQKKARRRRI